MNDQEHKSRRISPLVPLGGFVATIRPEEAVELTLGEESVLIAVARAPHSSINCRIRIVAARHIGIKRLGEDDVARLIRALPERV
jgi:hypothetical protein